MAMVPGLSSSGPIDPDASTPTSVYRYYDRMGFLLYVGITSRNIQRNDEHTAKEWWPYVVRQDVEHFPTRAHALSREKLLIQLEEPPFNKQHNPHHAELRAAYLGMRGTMNHAGPVPVMQSTESAMDIYRSLPLHRLPLIARHQRLIGKHQIFVTEARHQPLAKRLAIRDDSGAAVVPIHSGRRRFGHLSGIKHGVSETSLLIDLDDIPPRVIKSAWAEVQYKTGKGADAVFIKRIVVNGEARQEKQPKAAPTGAVSGRLMEILDAAFVLDGEGGAA